MGKFNVYKNKKHYDKLTIDRLFLKFNENNRQLWSLFEDKKFSNDAQFYNDLARNISRENVQYFKRLMRGPVLCKFCSIEIPIFEERGKYCLICTKQRKWTPPAGSLRAKEIGQKVAKIYYANKEYYDKIKKESAPNISKALKKFYQSDAGRERARISSETNSRIMKAKIANGEFTPTITNSWTQWTAEIEFGGNIKKFRSSWEACFYLSNPHLEYETIRIKYGEENKTYIADFYDSQRNILYEIKPKSQWKYKSDKMQHIINYCFDNGIDFVWINENNILDFLNYRDFSNSEINQKQYSIMMKGVSHGKTCYN